MAVLDPRTWMEVLPEAECWRLLRLATIGRLAMTVDGEPTIWPLNVAVDGRAIVFRTGHGSKLAGLDRLAAGDPRTSRVAVEVDGLDFDARQGWSVVATGRPRTLAGDDLARAQALPLAPWTAGEKPRWFAVDVDHVSGRAIGDRAARHDDLKP